MAKLLLIDDDEDVYEFLSQALVGHDVDWVSDWAGVSPAVSRAQPDLVLMDLNLPVLRGDALIRTLRSYHRDLRVVLFSAEDASELRRIASETGALGSLQKTFNVPVLRRQIERFLLQPSMPAVPRDQAGLGA